MYLVIANSWESEAPDVAQTIANILGILVFEARQKITGGNPVTIANFSVQQQAENIATQLSRNGVPAFIVDTHDHQPLFQVSQFELKPQGLQIESTEGQRLNIDYSKITLILAASYSDGQMETIKTTTSRKFSMGKTLLAGGIPMTKKIKKNRISGGKDRDKTLWLYSDKQEIVIFNRNRLNYAGLGGARQLTRELNFTHLQNKLRQRAPQARYDERLMKQTGLVNLLGPSLDPETHLALAFEILAKSLRSPVTDSK